MAEDQTQQTRVLLVNGQTIIIQGDVGDDAINEINADLLQQALHEVSSSTDNAQEGVGEEYSTDNQLLESEGGNYVIVQGEEGESTTIQLTTEQAEALGIHFSAEGEVKSETSENTSEGNVTIATGDGQLIYNDNSSQNGNELVFKNNTSSNGSPAVIQVQGGQMVDTQTCQVVQPTSGIDVLSNTVNAFMDDGSNQPIALIPQIVNGQVTYTVKIQDNSSNNVVLPENQFQSTETSNKEPSVSFHSSATSNTITSYVTPSGSSINYGSSSSSQGMSIQTLPLESFHSVEGNILTDSQNVQYVIMPPSDTDGRTMMVQKAVQPGSSFETFQPVKNDESSGDSQVPIAGVYSTVTAVDTSSPVTVAPPTIPVTKSLTGTPIENASSINSQSVPSGSLSTVASSMNKSGMIRVVTSDRSILQPLNARSGANKYSGTSILSNAGRLATTVPSGIGSKTVTINSSGPKSSIKFKAVAPTPAKPTSLLAGFSKLTPFTPGTARILPTTSAKVVTINPITSKVTVPTKQSLLNITSNLAPKPPLTSASLVLSSDSPRLSTSSTPTSSILTSTSIAPTLKTRILPATPKVVTINPTMARLGLNSSTQKVVPISSATPKIVTVNTYGPKIVSVSGATGIKNTTSSTNANTSQTISTSTSLTPLKMMPAKVNSLKPLGSSENPIQLVQHGSSFHSVQTLSESQLRQIATVLQQQNLDSTPRTKNVLYDAETKTRIIYRVVYPEDLDLHEPGSPSDRKGYSVRGRGKRGRPPKSAVRGPGRYDNRSLDMDLDEDGMLNDSTKDERKKLLPRTRSGRLSRPPRHMVKDYKRLHHLDFADADLDDSDGGYSDYQVSEPEEGEPEKAESKEELLEGLVIPKRKISSHFRCPTCQKIYLGRNRMARHFEMYPDHGNIDQIHVPSQTQANLGVGDTKAGLSGLNGVVRRGRGRGRRRGTWGAYMTPEARSQRRIIKLKEAMTGCEAGELTEVCGPAVAGLLSLWDLMLLRVEAVRTEETYVATLCDELQALLEKVRSLANDMLKPRNVEAKEHHFELQDKVLCSALGLPCGVYNVDDRCLRSRKHSLSLDDDDDDDDEASPPTKQARADLSDDSNQPSRLLQPAHDSKLDLKKSVCPEVLSALTLVAKTTEDHLRTKISGTVKGDRIDNFDLQSTQEEMDVVESAATSVGSANISAQSFSNTDHHSEALQTVDEIVNESLKKLQFNTDAVSQSQSTVSRLRRDSTSNRVNKYMVLSKSDDGGESFDPEIALASMGKVDQPSNSSDFATMNIPNNSGPSYTLVPMNGRTNIDDTHDSFLDMSHMETDSNDHRFDPEVTMTTLGLECSSSEIKNEESKFITSISAMDTSSKVSHSTKDLDMFNTNCSNPAVSHKQLTGKHVSSYSPEEMLASMEENNQTSDLKPSDVQFSLPIPQVKMEVLADDNPNTFALVGDNLLVRQSDKSSSYIVSGVKEENTVPVQSGERQLLYQQSESTTNSSPFHAEMTLAGIGGENQTVATNNGVRGIISSSFTPEMALAAMGEGDRNSSADSSEISFQVPLSTSRTVVDQTGSGFDPEAALAAMGEGEQPVPVTTQFQPHVSSSSSTFTLQQGFMEVGLDESGPELDFEALSEEFNRNTRHS